MALNPNLKIAIIEDSDLIRRSIVECLEANQYSVVGEAKNAKEAISLIQQNQANVYIIDVVMPEVSGLELAKQIHKNIPEAKLIIMSSLNLESVVIEAISSGAFDFLSKPFEMSDLIDSLKKIEQEMLNEL